MPKKSSPPLDPNVNWLEIHKTQENLVGGDGTNIETKNSINTTSYLHINEIKHNELNMEQSLSFEMIKKLKGTSIYDASDRWSRHKENYRD